MSQKVYPERPFEFRLSIFVCVCLGSHDKTIRVWDRIQGMCKMTLKGHTQVVWSCVISSRDDFLVTH